MNNTLYDYIDSTDKSTYAKYFFIFIFLVFLLKNVNIKIGVIMSIIFVAIYFIYNSQKNTHEDNIIKKQRNIKLENLYSKEKIKDYTDILDFMFSIQDFYKFNAPAYEEMTENIEALIQLYQMVKINSTYCEDVYELMNSKKRNALNNLHSIIFSLPDDKLIIDKLNRSIKILDKILDRYIDKIAILCENVKIKQGYTTNRKNINYGPSGYSEYLDTIHSFDYF